MISRWRGACRSRGGLIRRFARTLLCCILGWSWLATLSRAGDWPQILGPRRNGKAEGERLAAAWPATGPKVLWQREVGRGFAGPAVVEGRLILFHRVGKELVAECLDPASGAPRWKTAFSTNYVSTISSDDGPRCVPVVDGNRVFLLGPGGELQCLALDSGQKLWFRQVDNEFMAPNGYFGAGSSPLVESEKLLLNVGGPKGAGLVALAVADGATLWQNTNEAASYSSPVAATINGQRHAIFVTRLNVVSVDPQTGTVRFRFPFGARGPTVNAANPLVLDDHLFVSASYGVGASWSKIEPTQAVKVWENDHVMSSQYTTCVEHDGMLYGIDGRQDVGVARLRCFDPQTAKVLWTEEDFGAGSLILADDKLLIVKTDGELVLAEPSTEKFHTLARAKRFDTTTQALPALSAGRLFVRDTGVLKCFAVGPSR